MYAVAAQLRAMEVEAVAVCYLFSFITPDHERRTLDILRSELPGVYVSGSIGWRPR